LVTERKDLEEKLRQDYLRFLYMAVGSLYELRTQLEISFNLKFLNRLNLTDWMIRQERLSVCPAV